jgi:hypothetical protein
MWVIADKTSACADFSIFWEKVKNDQRKAKNPMCVICGKIIAAVRVGKQSRAVSKALVAIATGLLC